jgi:4-amino-4-deoxychorismate lyase
MFRFLESISIIEGEVQRLALHQRRVNLTLDTFCKGKTINLQDAIHAQRGGGNGTVKCRILYDGDVCEVQFSNYKPRQIKTLQIIENNDISYSFKFANREAIEAAFDLRGTCDDILLVKNGRITDSSIANIAFQRDGQWFTPREPLLKGTMRQYLLEHGVLRHAEINAENLSSFSTFKLINALLAFESPEYPVSNIHF